ncbi:MAG: Mrp/NBP35 family ATP-binding protein [Spirochaetes bacterium]|nr:Mrp/NBP35 family ATP-binding protein [Spirochaetota bacterium]MBU1080962.1 Mrp/NBP35 family ATP-binding protein [Spirochaetota bacterium]
MQEISTGSSEPAAGGARIKRVIGVASGKGGVGKSTVAVLLAQALAAKGHSVGLLDADITGPSVPRLLGLSSFRGESDGQRLVPIVSEEGIKVVSINFYVGDEATPVVWRGPLLSKAIEQFWTDVQWGELDYLVVDFPPGTGDIQITAFNKLPVSGVVVATTPQSLVSMIVAKSVKMAGMVDAPVLGVVENMGSMVCPSCGVEHKLFDSLDGSTVEQALGLPVLARFPWREEVAQAASLRWEALPEDFRRLADGLASETLLALAAVKKPAAGEKPAAAGKA